MDALPIRCAENISLLYLIHSVPVPPSSVPIDQSRIREAGYTLPFETERSLTKILAFLSSVKDDPHHIPAACVREISSSGQLEVLVAVNKASWEDGRQALQEIELGFQKVFGVLSRVISEGKSSTEDDVLEAIVSMCSERILCRLRLRTNSRKKPKQPIKEVIRDALKSLRQVQANLPNKREALQAFSLFMERAKKVIDLVDAWANHQTQTRLKDLIHGVHHLRQVEDLCALFKTIPNRLMSPSSKDNLLNIIRKVARYREAAQFLYRTAGKFSLVRQAKLVPVHLPQGMFHNAVSNQYIPSLESTVAKAHRGIGPKNILLRLSRQLNISQQEAATRFSDQTRKTLSEAKIHAEIQLISYIEFHKLENPPRTISSSKDACYLCYALIRMHGKIHTQRCHGRLYPGWRLPHCSELNDIARQFNGRLEENLRESIRILLNEAKKTMHPDPKESTLSSLPVSTSTLVIPVVPIANSTEPFVKSIQSGNSLPASTNDYITSTGVISIKPKLSTSTDHLSSGTFSRQSSLVQPSPCKPDLENACHMMRMGQPLSGTIDESSSPLHSAEKLNLQIEYAARMDSTSVKSTPRRLTYVIEWLTISDAVALRKSNATVILNAEAVDFGCSYPISESKCVYLSYRGSIIKIDLNAGTV